MVVNYLYRARPPPPRVSIKSSLNPCRWLRAAGTSVQAAVWADPEVLERDREVEGSGRRPAWCSLPPGGQAWIIRHFWGVEAQTTPPKSFCTAPVA